MKYAGGLTYLHLKGGKCLYLATVIDLSFRRLTGWAIAGHLRTDLVIDALAAAERTRGLLNAPGQVRPQTLCSCRNQVHDAPTPTYQSKRA